MLTLHRKQLWSCFQNNIVWRASSRRVFYAMTLLHERCHWLVQHSPKSVCTCLIITCSNPKPSHPSSSLRHITGITLISFLWYFYQNTWVIKLEGEKFNFILSWEGTVHHIGKYMRAMYPFIDVLLVVWTWQWSRPVPCWQ